MNRRTIAIVDRSALAKALAAVVEPHGSTANAARKLGILQPSLYRLLKCLTGAIRPKTLKTLRRILGADSAVLDAAILTPDASASLSAYETWLDTQRAVASGAMGGKLEKREFEDLLAWCAKHLPEDLKRLASHAKQKGMSEQRLGLAVNRLFAGLASSAASGYVELRWDEMRKEDLVACIRAGVRRELKLMNRSPDQVRAQQHSGSKHANELAKERKQRAKYWTLQAGSRPVGSR